jgi:hypothetical protein
LIFGHVMTAFGPAFDTPVQGRYGGFEGRIDHKLKQLFGVYSCLFMQT